MSYNNTIPEWENTGTEPSEELRKGGFKSGYKPPAGVFNWFWSKVTKCINELQTKLKEHSHTLADVTETDGRKMSHYAEAVSTDGVIYTATVEGVTELYNGLEITIVPNTKSTSVGIKLNVNGLGEVPVRRPLSFSTFVATSIDSDRTYFLAEKAPCRLMYHANYTSGGIWLMADKVKYSAQDLYGTVPIESGGTGAATVEGAREALGVYSKLEIDAKGGWITLGSKRIDDSLGSFVDLPSHLNNYSEAIFVFEPFDADKTVKLNYYVNSDNGVLLDTRTVSEGVPAVSHLWIINGVIDNATLVAAEGALHQPVKVSENIQYIVFGVTNTDGGTNGARTTAKVTVLAR